MKGGDGNGGNHFQYSGNADFQQQQQQHRTVSSVYGNPARSKHTMTSSIPHHNVPQYNVAQNSMINQRSNPINNQIKVQQAQSHLANMQHQPPPQQQQHRTLNSQMQMVLNQNYNSNRAGNHNIRIQ